MGITEWPPEPGTAIVVAALEGVFRGLNVPLEPTTTSSPATPYMRSIMQSFKLGSNGAWEQRSTSPLNPVSSASISSSMPESEGSSSLKKQKDEFGNVIEEGDIVASASMSTGNMKIGKAYYQKSGALWIEHITEAGYFWSKRKWNSETNKYEDNPKSIKTQAGSNTLLLRRADGTLTDLMQNLIGGHEESP